MRRYKNGNSLEAKKLLVKNGDSAEHCQRIYFLYMSFIQVPQYSAKIHIWIVAI